MVSITIQNSFLMRVMKIINLTFKKCTNFDIQHKKFGSKAKHHLSEI